MSARDPVQVHRRTNWFLGLWTGNDAFHDGAILGVLMGIGIWVWLVAVDALTGNVFHVFAMLGGLTLFSVMHFALNVVYGITIVSVVRAAARAPSLIIALIFFFVALEIGFAMLTVLLSNVGLGKLAWVQIFGGNLIGATIAFLVLSRREPLRVHLQRAEDER